MSRTHAFFAALVAHPLRVLVGAALVTAVALVGVLRLEVLTAREALMPRDAPAMIRLDQFLAQFGAASDLIVVLEGGRDPDAFSRALVQRLAARPEVGQVFDRVPPEALGAWAWLLVPAPTLAALAEASLTVPPDALSALSLAEKSIQNMELGDVDLARAVQALDALAAFLAEWSRLIGDPQATPSWTTVWAPVGGEALGRFRSRDGGLSFLFVRAAHPSTEFTHLDPFIRAVRAEGAALAATWPDPPGVGLAGLPAVAWEEFVAVQADIALVTATSAGLIGLLVLLWLRSWRRAVAIFVPMGLGVVWSLGLTEVLIGHLTILTSSFTAILFGLGVDYGIFLNARVAALGRVERGAAAALHPLLVAGGATALIFLTLATSDFQGFAELGLVAALGVGLVVAATLVVQPALLTLLPTQPFETKEETEGEPPPAGPPRRGLAVAVLGLGLAGAAAGLGAGAVPFDYDVLNLLPRDSEAARLQRRMAAESDFQAEVVLIAAPSVEAARSLAAAVGALPSIARVQSVDLFFPPDAAARVAPARALGAKAAALQPGLAAVEFEADPPTREALARVLASLREVLETAQESAFSAGQTGLVAALDRVLAQLETLAPRLASEASAAGTRRLARDVVDRLRAAAAVVAGFRTARPPTPGDLPPVLRDRFVGRDGQVAVYAWPRESVYDPRALATLNAEVLAVAPMATGFPITHHVFSGSVVQAYHQGTLLAAGAALLFIVLSLRRPRPILVAVLPLALGGLWMNGLMHVLDLQVNFASVVALPLVMGLAVDYGVWVAHQAEAHPALGWGLVRRAGSALLLAAATTLAGLGAIMLGHYQGVASMGRSLTLGLLACLVAALVVAPALLVLLPQRRLR